MPFLRHRRSLPKILAVAALTTGCTACKPESDSSPSGDTEYVSDTWGIGFPSGTEIVNHYSSESDFQGGRDDICILDIPAQEGGYWATSAFTSAPSSIASGGQPLARLETPRALRFKIP